ncbi:MAG TPA: type II secretion system F family protein, partial [Burkholderiales bacterium]|nr:type II secretion system F family protein [Burkholderiales bacterium]
MARYAYRGRDSRGDVVTGTLEGPDTGAIADQLLSIGVTPVDISPATGTGLGAPAWWRSLTAQRISQVDVMLFSRQMYTLLRSGVPILRALAGLQESTTNASLSEIIGDMRSTLDAGRELSTAMRRHPGVFNTFYVSVVRIGEATGALDESFNRLFHYIEFEKEMRERISTATRYPLIVLVVIAVAIGVVNFAVIPAFARVFTANKVPLPLLTQLLIASSHFFLAYWPALLVGLVALVVGFQVYVGTPHGGYLWDRTKLRLPIMGPIVLKATLARFARSLALATRA